MSHRSTPHRSSSWRRDVATVSVAAAAIAAAAACSPARPPERRRPVAVPMPPIPTAPSFDARPPTEPTPEPTPPACTIVGTKATMTVVVRAGSDDLPVAIEEAPVVVVPGDGGTNEVTVGGALRFVGRADGLEFFPVSPVVVADGVVELGPMSVLRATRRDGGELVAETVDIGPGFQLGSLRVPCSELTFVGSGHASEAAHRGNSRSQLQNVSCAAPCVHYATPQTLDFHALPEDDTPIRLTGSTIVGELEKRQGWSRVTTVDHVHIDGARLTGWVEVAGLEKVTGGFGFTGGRGSLPPRSRGRGSRRAGGPGIYQGPARIDADSPVFSAAEGGHRWATVRDGAAEFEVVFRTGDARAEIWSAPSIPLLRGAWVSLKAVHPTPPIRNP